MKDKFKRVHMAVAAQYAELSYAQRRKVGCVIVIDGMVFPGYNGTPEDWDNQCETEDGSKTLPEVIHAEQNALDKITRSTLSSVGASVFVTTAPALNAPNGCTVPRFARYIIARSTEQTKALNSSSVLEFMLRK